MPVKSGALFLLCGLAAGAPAQAQTDALAQCALIGAAIGPPQLLRRTRGPRTGAGRAVQRSSHRRARWPPRPRRPRCSRRRAGCSRRRPRLPRPAACWRNSGRSCRQARRVQFRGLPAQLRAAPARHLPHQPRTAVARRRPLCWRPTTDVKKPSFSSRFAPSCCKTSASRAPTCGGPSPCRRCGRSTTTPIRGPFATPTTSPS